MYKRSRLKKKRSELFYSMGHRTKTERKKVKRENKERRARNKRLILSYPWLKPVSVWNGKPIENPRYDMISLWDEVPKGWTNIFGRMMCDEIDENLRKYAGLRELVYVEQAKEKYGGLRLYMTVPSDVWHIISIYEQISENVCCKCGKPHTPMLSISWISPYCKECYEAMQKKNKNFYRQPYEFFAPEDKSEWVIPPILKWTRYLGNDKTDIIEEDITGRIAQIEKNYERSRLRSEKNKSRSKAKKVSLSKEEQNLHATTVSEC